MTSPEGTIAAPKQGGVFEDLIEVLFAPTKVFDRSRAAKAIMYVLITAVIVAVIVFATKNLIMPWLDAQADLTLKIAAAKGKPIPDAAVSSIRTTTSYSILIGAPLIMLIGPYINALFLVIGAKLMKAPISFAQAALIATLGGVPRILGWLALPVQALLLNSSSAKGLADFSLGPARFLDPATTSPAVLALLSNLDIFRLWQIALIAIGVSVVGRVSKSTGVLVAIVMAGIAAILQLIPSAFFG